MDFSVDSRTLFFDAFWEVYIAEGASPLACMEQSNIVIGFLAGEARQRKEKRKKKKTWRTFITDCPYLGKVWKDYLHSAVLPTEKDRSRVVLAATFFCEPRFHVTRMGQPL
jgi:hypothetical protein